MRGIGADDAVVGDKVGVIEDVEDIEGCGELGPTLFFLAEAEVVFEVHIEIEKARAVQGVANLNGK
jgi:hypothetical protein